MADVVEIGLALWILLAPAGLVVDHPGWPLRFGVVTCEARRGARLDADNTLCARLPATPHQEYSPPSDGRVPSWEGGELAITTR